MLVYARISPQEKLKSLKSQSMDLQQAITAYDGDFSGAMALTKQNLRLTFQRLGCVLWPSIVAGLPVLAALFFVEDNYIPFFLATFVTALFLKFACKIA
ncbi:MAG: hypothetical protein SH868_15985 [Bythopirellula sp.]|nr:hypothetical protein [Bythopirellula sp.]